MQKPLRIDYYLSYWPIVSFIALFLVFIICLFLLNLHWIYRSGLLLVGIIYFAVIFRQLMHGNCEVLSFDEDQWFASKDGKKLLLELQQETFVSRFLLVLVFKVTDSKQQVRCYFAADNCSEADYRSLCCLLIS